MKIIKAVLGLFLVLLSLQSIAQLNLEISNKNDYGTIHPEAPEQLLDYKELIGTCDCISMQINQQGKFADTVLSTWTFRYIMDGTAIQDETYKNDGKHTSSIRQFNTDSMQWYVTFFNSSIAVPNPPVWSGYSRKGADKMVLKMPQKSPNGMNGFSKLTFYDISTTGFKWIGEWVTPNESVAFPFWKIECVKRRNFHFLHGKWKKEGKEEYEVWKKQDNGKLMGYVFNVIEGKKLIYETLHIETTDGKTIYSAQVREQNDDQIIRFSLNTDVTDRISFENTKHDFPQKIQYQKLSEDELFVNVLGGDGKGYSYKLIRQK